MFRKFLLTLVLGIAALCAGQSSPVPPQFQNVYINDNYGYGLVSVITQFQMSPGTGALLDTGLSYNVGTMGSNSGPTPQTLATAVTPTNTCLFASGMTGTSSTFIPEVKPFRVAVGGNLTAASAEIQFPSITSYLILPDIIAYKNHLYVALGTGSGGLHGDNSLYVLNIANNCTLTMGPHLVTEDGFLGGMSAGTSGGVDYLAVPANRVTDGTLQLFNISSGGLSLASSATSLATATVFQPQGSIFWTLDFNLNSLVISSWGVVGGQLTPPTTYSVPGPQGVYGMFLMSNSTEYPALYSLHDVNESQIELTMTPIRGNTLEIGGTITHPLIASGRAVGQMTEDVACHFVVESQPATPNELLSVFAEPTFTEIYGSPFNGPTFQNQLISNAIAVPASVNGVGGCAPSF